MRRKKITVIEDDIDLQILIRIALAAQDYDVSAAKDDQALDGGSADLYVIDINLEGGRSGVDICRELKAGRHKVPIVILISANPDLQQFAREAGADDTLQKPFSTTELLDKISGHLSACEKV